MFSSTIIPTIDRPTLSRAVESVLQQELPGDDFEVIVVNDSGEPLPVFAWQKSSKVRVLDTNRRERSVARNAGAALANGRYLHFLDDDDWLLPGALMAFYNKASKIHPEILYGGFNFVSKDNQILEENRPDEAGNLLIRLAAGEWLPLQATLINADAFFRTQGFEPSLIPYQDNDLMMQLALIKEFEVLERQVVNIVRDIQGSTTNYQLLTENLQWSREKLLNNPGVFLRLQSSARTRSLDPAYWQGRITFLYLLSAYRNLPKRRLFKFISRLVYSAINIFTSGASVFNRSFWRGTFTSHTTHGFMRSDGILK